MSTPRKAFSTEIAECDVSNTNCPVGLNLITVRITQPGVTAGYHRAQLRLADSRPADTLIEAEYLADRGRLAGQQGSPGASRRSQAGRGRRIVQEAGDRGGQRPRVAGRDEQGCSLAGQLGDPAGPGGDQRRPARSVSCTMSG